MKEHRHLFEALATHWKKPFHVFGWFIIGGLSVISALGFTTPDRNALSTWASSATSTPETVFEGVHHVPLPKEVRGVYMTAGTAASKQLRSGIFAYLKRNRMNAVVIDVKDDNGAVVLPDLDAVLNEAGEQGLYRIARVFVFQDPLYVQRFPAEAIQKQGGGVWADYKGVTWVDPASKAAWRYNVEIAREAYARGFDEVQFDYIRFPSDGAMKTIDYVHYDGQTPKHEVIRDFFRFMHEQLEVKERIPISFDLFGYTTWYVDFDLGIGQLLVDALPNATAISAMVYPSHYGNGVLGFPNPAAHPYEIIADSLKKANKLYQRKEKECTDLATGVKSATSTFLLPCDVPLAHHRPWIQAFDIGAVYDAGMINAQIKAVRDQGGKGYLLWNARNVYRDFAASSTSTSDL